MTLDEIKKQIFIDSEEVCGNTMIDTYLAQEYVEQAYNKAIDDFAEKIIRYVDCGHLCSQTEIRWSDLAVVEMVKKLAEQLKAGDGE